MNCVITGCPLQAPDYGQGLCNRHVKRNSYRRIYGGGEADWAHVGALRILFDHENGGDAIVTDPGVVDWLDGLSLAPDCCGHRMIGWGPRDPDLFHCLYCHGDREVAR